MSRLGNARSKKELEEQLQKASKQWWDGCPGKMAINGYGCGVCKGQVMTVDMDRGTTPMYMGCKATEGCHGTMASFGYPSTPPPKDFHTLVKVFEWYRPETNGLGFFHEDQVVDEYVRRGGLLLRERTKND